MSSTVTLTRGRLAAFAAAVAVGSAGISGGVAWAAHSFSDVPDSNPFHDEIAWGATHGVIEGYLDGTFKPTNTVTRQAAAAFIARYNDTIHTETTTVFPTGNTIFSAVGTCPAGERPLMGAGNAPGGNLFITDSHPTGAADENWTVTWETEGNAVVDPSYLSVTVLCAPLGL